MSHYCHNCRYPGELTGAYCRYCLTFYYAHGRLPTAGDAVTRKPTQLESAYAAMGWNLPAALTER